MQAGLVEAEKSGRFVYYRVDRSAFRAAAAYLAGFTGKEPRAPAPAPKCAPVRCRESVA